MESPRKKTSNISSFQDKKFIKDWQKWCYRRGAELSKEAVYMGVNAVMTDSVIHSFAQTFVGIL